jgi:hypothetical protein
VGFLRSHGDLESAQSVLTGDARNLSRQHCADKIASLDEVGIREPCQEVIREYGGAAS